MIEYLQQHSDRELSKKLLYLREYLIPSIEQEWTKTKFYYLSGIRRIGKKSLMHHIAQSQTTSKVIMIQFDTLTYDQRRNTQEIIAFIAHTIQEHGSISLFCNGVERLDGKEELIQYLHQEKGIEHCFITTAHELVLLQLLESVGCDYAGHKIFPMTYEEYATHGKKYRSFRHYVRDTGIPEALSLEKAGHQPIFDYYFQSLINTILLQDVMGLYAITNAQLLRATFEYVLQQTSQPLTYHYIASQLQLQGYNAHHATIKSYCRYFEDVGLYHKLKTCDITLQIGHQFMMVPIDHGIANYYYQGVSYAQALLIIMVNRLLILGYDIAIVATYTHATDIVDYTSGYVYLIVHDRSVWDIESAIKHYQRHGHQILIISEESIQVGLYDSITGSQRLEHITQTKHLAHIK